MCWAKAGFLRGPRVLLLLASAAPGIGQMENSPYFALSSGRTFGSGRAPTVALSAWNVDSLEFRVYRVNDPVKFFQQLEDPHQFSGQAMRPSGKRTPLERLHAWKRTLRAGIRRALRAQFTEPPSAHFQSVLPRRAAPVSGGTRYAEAPLLNPDQLVLSFVQPVRSARRWETQSVDIGVNQKGVYLVEAVKGDLRAYTILTVSDIVMITKTGRGGVVAFLADRVTGEPLADASVWMLTRDAPPGEIRPNADGIAEIPVTSQRPDDVRIVARRGADVAATALASWNFRAGREPWMGYIYTDRPVYRPGHTVHSKGVFRARATAGYEVPAGKVVTLEIRGPDQKPVYQKSSTTNANGTVHDEFVLDAAAALGNYYIEARNGESYMSGDFSVEEYKKPEYEVRVTPARARVLQGEHVQAAIEARYYFGEPVSGAKVKYAVYRSRYWYPLWQDAEQESPDQFEGLEDGGGEDEQIVEAEGRLDQDGKLTVDFAATPSGQGADYRYRIEARVTDPSRREIDGTGWAVATYGSFLVNVRPDRYFYAPAGKASITVEARDYDNHAVRTSVHVELLKWKWRDPSRSELRAATDATTSAEGTAAAELRLPQDGGSYRVRVSARTPEGHEVQDSLSIWVSGGAETDFLAPGRKTIQIIPDKKSYRPGETARLLIVAGAAGTPVLVSVEGRDLRRYELIHSTDTTVVFDVPISVEDEPGFFIAAQFIRHGELYQSSRRIKVPPEEHKLNVKLSTDKTQHLPGEFAGYRVDVTDAASKPVPRAELTLGVVDEAIYAIRRDSTPDMLHFFFGNEWNSVYTDDSLDYYFSGQAGKRRMLLAQLRPPSKLAQLKPDRLVLPKVRKVFPDTAFWAADITTDESGRATARVQFPDSPTTWRATARGIAPGTKVGGAVLKTLVRKNLILRLAVPRFFVQGDEVVISAIVHNYLPTAKKTRVALKLTGLDVLEGADREVEIPSRGETRLDWRARAQPVRSATVTGQALTDEESDALELDLPVNPPGVKLSEAKGGSLSNGANAAFSLTFPQRVEPGSRSLSIRLSPSIAGSLFGALEFLTTYPYGCVEQTMSSFLPNIVVMKSVRDLGLKPNIDEAGLREKIRDGLDRLRAFQHEDGGWGWWETDESHPFMTAYVAAGLAQARLSGVSVDDYMVNKGVAWLGKSFARSPRLAPDLRAYIAYALTLNGNPSGSVPDAVYAERSALSPYGTALLGLAFEQGKDARAAGVAAALESAVKQSDEEAWWPAERDEMLDFVADVTPEATAYAVKLLSHQRPSSPLLPKAALWLMNHRNEGYWWSSTKQTAMVIFGLADYLKASGELKPNFTATVFVNDQQVLSRTFTDATAIAAPEVTIDEARLQPGEDRIRVTASGQGRLYYSARADYYSTEERLQRTGGISLNILRDYFRLAPAKEGDRIVYETTPLDGPVASGDLLAVRLTVTGSSWRYLLLEDPIPAGTEFVAQDDLYALRDRPPWWQYWFTRREFHDDRMAIFQTDFAQGQRPYFYLLKVVNPGAFRVSPARVQPMYQPMYLSTSESRRLEVKRAGRRGFSACCISEAMPCCFGPPTTGWAWAKRASRSYCGARWWLPASYAWPCGCTVPALCISARAALDCE